MPRRKKGNKALEEELLKRRLIEIADAEEPNDGTQTFINRGGDYLSGLPYLFSGDARRAFCFRDEQQARDLIAEFPLALEGCGVGAFHREKQKPRCDRCAAYTDHTTEDCPRAIFDDADDD